MVYLDRAVHHSVSLEMALPTSLHLGVSPEQRLLESFNRNKEGGKEEGKKKKNGLVSEGRQ